MSKLDIFEKIKEYEDRHNIKIIYLIKSGSQLHGTATELSDTDYAGIFVQKDIKDYIVGNPPKCITQTTGDEHTKNSADDIDISLHSLQSFLRMCKDGDTGALDLLFSLKASNFDSFCVYINNKAMQCIVDNIDKLVSRQMRSFVGYCLNQAKRYNIKGTRFKELDVFLSELKVAVTESNLTAKTTGLIHLKPEITEIVKNNNLKYIKFVRDKGPRAQKGYTEVDYLEVLGKKYLYNLSLKDLLEKLTKLHGSFGNRTRASLEGVDRKSLSHAMRIIQEGLELTTTGTITFPRPNAAELLHLKYFVTIEELDDVMQKLELLVEDLYREMEDSALPEAVDKNLIDEITLKIVQRITGGITRIV